MTNKLKKDKFLKAWRYLESLKYFNPPEIAGLFGFGNFDIMVSSETTPKGTNVYVELNTGSWNEKYSCFSHDYRLDVSCPTFEDAIIELAKKCKKLGRKLNHSVSETIKFKKIKHLLK